MKTLILILLLNLSLMGELIQEAASQKLLDSKIPIVDVRTVGEWKETGVLKGAITIVFFDERGGYDIEAFLKELNSKVDTKKPFAVICRTASRTKLISEFLSSKLNYTVTDIQGGMVYAKSINLPIVPYK